MARSFTLRIQERSIVRIELNPLEFIQDARKGYFRAVWNTLPFYLLVMFFLFLDPMLLILAPLPILFRLKKPKNDNEKERAT